MTSLKDSSCLPGGSHDDCFFSVQSHIVCDLDLPLYVESAWRRWANLESEVIVLTVACAVASHRFPVKMNPDGILCDQSPL